MMFGGLFGKRKKETRPGGNQSGLGTEPTTRADRAVSRLSSASEEERVALAMELLKSPDAEVREAVAGQVARLGIRGVGAWYELANALADDAEVVRHAAAGAFWKLDGVGYAIRSMRDEYVGPQHMSKSAALRGIAVLREKASDKARFAELLRENWEDCPSGMQGKSVSTCGSGGTTFYEPKTATDKLDFVGMQRVRVGCSKCGAAVCFSCAATAADQQGKSGNCVCPKCGAELGAGGEAGTLGNRHPAWN